MADNTKRKLPIESITLDPDLQPRVVLDQGTVIRYVEALKRGDSFPAVVVFHEGTTYRLADGFHRVTAAKNAGMTEIEADVRSGSKKEALLYSVSANEEHGLPRSHADKRKAIMSLLADPDLGQYSDREIGRFVGSTTRPYRSTAENFLAARSQQSQVGNSPLKSSSFLRLYNQWNIWKLGLTKDNIAHKGQLPETLMENVLFYWSEPGQMVYDPFAFIGFMGFVAERMGRRFELSDIAPLDSHIKQHDILTGFQTG